MNPNIGIVHTDRCSDGLYMVPDNPNTLTYQSVATNDDPRDPLHGSITLNPAQVRPGSTLRLHPRLRSRHFHHRHILPQTLSLHQQPKQGRVIYPPQDPPLTSEFFALFSIPFPNSTKILRSDLTQIPRLT